MSGDRLKMDEKFDSVYVYLPLNKITPCKSLNTLERQSMALSLYLCEFELFSAIFYELVG